MKFNVHELNQTLQSMGMHAENILIVKNGVKCAGLKINDETNTSQIVYYDESDTFERIMTRIIKNQKTKLKVPNAETLFRNKQYVLEHITVAVQKQSDEEIIKRRVLNVDAFLKLHVDTKDDTISTYTRVTKALVQWLNISEETLWEAALQNTQKMLKITSMWSLFNKEEITEEAPFFVVTLKNFFDGAAALLFPEIFRSFCEQKSERSCLILPSSTEEVLIMPESQVALDDPRIYACMVDSINKREVNPLIQLEPVIYKYSLDTNCIEIVAEA